MGNTISVSVEELIKYDGELYLAVNELNEAVEKVDGNRFSEADINRLKEACSELRSLAESVSQVALEYKDLDKNIIDALICV